VKCVVNARDLRPTASREAFYEDALLARARLSLGGQLRQYLINLAENSPSRLRELIKLHQLSFKALAVDDDEFFRIFMKWLPFETNMGSTTLTEYIENHEAVRYVPSWEEFKQTAAVAAAQQLCVINGGYTYDEPLILKLGEMIPSIQIIHVDAHKLVLGFTHLTLDEQSETESFLKLAAEVLQPFECMPEIRSFFPGELAALYNADPETLFKRSISDTKEVVSGFWSSVLDEMALGTSDSWARLCFNYRNPVVHKVARINDENLMRHAVELLYVHAVLFSHRPLNEKEMALLNSGVLGFIDWGVNTFEGWIQ